MKNLNAVEQKAFEIPTGFNSVQRKRHFDFSMETRRQAVKLRTPTNRLCFLLNCGYFKASKRFFLIGLSHRPDIEYVARRAGLKDFVDSQKIRETSDPLSRDKLIQAISNGSVITWLHINLLCEYDFSVQRLQDSVGIKPPNTGRPSEVRIWRSQN
jgi:hypothetical protein